VVMDAATDLTNFGYLIPMASPADLDDAAKQ
jgi:hypothetical protein